ncbi:uncharacterized protein LOC110835323 [Zootermopsis nevadensis]|uniref:F-box only protein 21 n=1 Tax=Zootermopsis nevadensis TaxID=136037 RepID=A0A067R363_ZOONE|nr:uncharacterized protein LOC110835323 [Zootermopsis nevadensis]XP_021931118.1 uncharacterized protein LOC110835323 [Zootermopsis nevadensis]XP_021931119.1 uncharacterized protein LOC110835323 [Zootermopsis nevadensis]XP_021931120.1 uncharacterized protein LOC110835323 [Zootermopsis nevadensis]KDR13515.1 F-box only protein 21 [Zootermopsis nevadensis]
MPLTQREAVQLGLLLLSVPVQYLLVGTGRPHPLPQDSWFKLEYWKARWLQFVSWILKAVIQPDDFSSTHKNESPAIEVLRYRQKAGYFTASLDARNERPFHLHYRIGQVVKHRTLGYKGVIVGWDLQAKAPESWLQRMYGNIKVLRNMPHYAVLVDEGDRPGSHSTYVVQELLELMKNTVVQHSEIKNNFEYFDGAQYIPREKLRILYPRD